VAIIVGNSKPLVFGIFLIGIFVIFSYGIGNVSATSANTIYVNNSGGDDSFDGTSWLTAKKSITNAVDSVSSDGTINIADGQYSGDKNTKIVITKNMNISGQSQKGTVINGTGTNWVFWITKSYVKFSITNLTITNSSFSNGAFLNYGGTCNVTNCTFSYNKAKGSGSGAGAIFNMGNMIIKESTFTANSDNDGVGGAIVNKGKMAVIDSYFINNTAITGGAILNENIGQYLTITNCEFVSNTADCGGAIYNGFDSIMNARGNSFINNNANSGGVIGNAGTANMKFNRIVGNTATQGNTIFNYYCGNIKALNNWWGTNTGPSIKDLVNQNGIANISTWLVLYITIKPNLMLQGGYSFVTADLNHNNNGVLQIDGYVPNGIPINFVTKLGTLIKAPLFITNGTSETMLHAGNILGFGNVTCTIDNQQKTAIFKIIDPLLPEIVETYPNRNQENIMRTAVISIKFNENMKLSTKFNNILVKNLTTGKTLTLARTIKNNTLYIKTSLKTANTWYRVIIPKSAIKDYAGSDLASDYSFKFKTGT
jgi:hypothetical protein